VQFLDVAAPGGGGVAPAIRARSAWRPARPRPGA
jgi:hypothetical protein